MPLLYRSSRRYLLRHPWQIGLSTLGVAMAVAVVVGIDLANASATRAFRLSVEGVAGRATHEIAGGPQGLDEELYVRLRVEEGWRRSAPVVEGYVASPRLPGRALRLFGVDPFAEELFRTFTRSLREGERTGDLAAFVIRPGAVIASTELAAELGLAVGDAFPVRVAGREHELVLVGLVEPADELARQSSRDLLVADVASAQEVLGRVGRLTRVDLVLDSADDAERLRRSLPAGVELRTKSARSGTLDDMTRAFRLNLQALSLLALLVGAFLIYNAMTFSVVQRRALIGTLRALGVTRREVFALVLAEAGLVAVVGSAAGLALGFLLAQGLLGLVVRTINDLYFVLSVREVSLTLGGWLKGALLGVGGTLLAALAPALEATRAPPRAVLLRSQVERRARRALPRLTAAGAVVLAAAGVLVAVPSKSLPLAFAAVFLVVMGSACLVPGLTFASMRLLRWPMARCFGVLGSLAARGVAAELSRTGVAVAALVVAVAMTVGVSIMIRSFRATLVDWLEVTLQADVYVAPADASGGLRVLDSRALERLAAVPGVERVTTTRRVEVGSPEGPVALMALGVQRPDFRIYSFAAGDPDEAWERFVAGDALVSEPFAFHHGVGLGESLELVTDRGPREFAVAGVYYNYASDRGIVTLHRDVYDRWWDDDAVQSLGVHAAEDADREALIERLVAAGGDQDLTVAANRELRRGALEVFDRTFVITGVLRLLAVAVAFIGVLSALMALELERSRELGVLRANGLTPGQVWGLVSAQTGLMGLVAGALAVPVGLVLASMLIHVINKRSFGWTLRMEVTPGLLAQAVLLALAAAVLAGLWPSYKMSKASPALALREE